MTSAPSLPRLYEEARIAMLVAMGAALGALENALFVFGPWFRPGLANIATLIAYQWLGLRAAVVVSIARIGLAALFTGTLLTPAFAMSAGGGLAALLVLALFGRVRAFSLAGISMLAAAAHITAQIAIASLLFVRGGALMGLFPYLVPPAMLAGWINGAVAGYIAERLR